ncbi:hypothetical protein [Hwanghaeella sp.]|uniref:hypothetical protein n=1 Tax=Hwanghaeella sp. TaxID=2605943 RepID=UPI003CCC363E
MIEVTVQKNFFLTVDEVDLLLGCTIDPLLRAQFHRAKNVPDGDFCLLTLTESELHEVYALLAELLTAEGLNEEGYFNEIGAKVDAIMVVLEAQMLPRSSQTQQHGDMPYPELLAAE